MLQANWSEENRQHDKSCYKQCPGSCDHSAIYYMFTEFQHMAPYS
jgi:hypothetical protein